MKVEDVDDLDGNYQVKLLYQRAYVAELGTSTSSGLFEEHVVTDGRVCPYCLATSIKKIDTIQLGTVKTCDLMS